MIEVSQFPPRKPRRFRSLVLAVLVGASLVACTVLAPMQAQAVPENFADMAERLLPSVVNIATTQVVDASRAPEMPQFPEGSPFEDFFKEFFEQQRGQNGSRPPQRAMSLGSGFVIDGSGYIVTNNHVIKDAEEITVVLQDDTVLKAEIKGVDEKTDLALLKVTPIKPLVAIEWGDSDSARVGEWVVAIGNPFGLGGSVTTGIISAKTRDINAGPYDSFIQTDASINKGNSGGPLFDERGRVIGINTVIFSPSGGSVGIGFAVPSNIARQVVADLKEHGRTRRGWIGVRIQSMTDEIAEGMGLSSTKGALVAAVTEEGPAAKAGIKVGDVILKFDGRDVPEMRALPRLVSETAIGKTVDVELWRDSKSRTVKLKVAELEEAEAQGLLEEGPKSAVVPSGTGPTDFKPLGLKVGPLDDAARKRFSIDDPEAKGVVVVEVDRDGDAAAKGVQPGTLILKADQKDVTSVADLTKIMADVKKEGKKLVLLLVDVRGTRTFVPIKLTEEKKK